MTREHNSYKPDGSASLDRTFVSHLSLEVEIPLDSIEYQQFLEVNRQRELELETYGYITSETQSDYLLAIQAVNNLAWRIYVGDGPYQSNS